MSTARPTQDPTAWYFLVYRIPTEPTRLRAGVWRKLKGLGAIYVQSSVAGLPASPAAERALRTLRAEIEELGGSAFLTESKIVAGHAQLVASFNQARDEEYEEIADKCVDFLAQLKKEYDAEHFTYAELEENDVDLAKLKGWFERIEARNVFNALGVERVREAIARCEHALDQYATRVYAEEGDGPLD